MWDTKRKGGGSLFDWLLWWVCVLRGGCLGESRVLWKALRRGTPFPVLYKDSHNSGIVRRGALWLPHQPVCLEKQLQAEAQRLMQVQHGIRVFATGFCSQLRFFWKCLTAVLNLGGCENVLTADVWVFHSASNTRQHNCGLKSYTIKQIYLNYYLYSFGFLRLNIRR